MIRRMIDPFGYPWIMVPGWGHTGDKLKEAAEPMRALGPRLYFEEVMARYKPQVMWCERYGPKCSLSGRTHPHWYIPHPDDSRGYYYSFKPWTRVTWAHEPPVYSINWPKEAILRRPISEPRL